MLEGAFGLIKEFSAFGLIVLLSCGAGLLVMRRWDGALKQAGTDRDRLLRSLRLGGNPRRYYVFLIGKALNRADRLLRDADKADLSLPSPVGNRKPAPYWTGWSFDVCALIAVFYPVSSLFLTWVLTGEAGELGDTLGLRAGLPGWQRWSVVMAFGCMAFALWRANRSSSWRSQVWMIGAGAGAFAVAGAGAFAVAVAVAGAVAGAFAVAVAFAGAGAFAGAVAFAGAGAGAVAVAFAVAVFGSVNLLAEKANRKRRLGTFWLYFWPVALFACYLILWAEIRLGVRDELLLLLVMLGLVPLVNIPFDWTSIGATRALLRRGCEPGALRANEDETPTPR